NAQAFWCINNLSSFEVNAVGWVGLSGALDICASNLETLAAAFAVLDEMEGPDALQRQGPDHIYAKGIALRDIVEASRAESRAFLPYTSVLSDLINTLTRYGTALLAVGIGLVYVVFARKLTEAESLQRHQNKALQELAFISERANDSIVLTDLEGRVTWVNPAFVALSGYTFDSIRGRKPGSLLQGPKSDPVAIDTIRTALQKQVPIKLELLNYARDGTEYWVNLSISPLKDHAQKCFGFAAISNDVTHARQQKAALEREKARTEHQANHDPLTGLPNRRFIDAILEDCVRIDDPPRTLVRIDLDHFKNINDTLGHAAGDFVLCQVADILRIITRPTDVAARIGGDEFVILLEHGTTQDNAFAMTERLRAEIRKDMVFEDQVCRVGASFGISSAGEDHVENVDLMKSADAALYAAKETGRNTTALYTPEIHAGVLEKRRLSTEIERGIENLEFEAFFHPQFHAETEILIGVEALARWRHPTRGLVSPGEFLPVAEQLRLVSEIDKQVFSFGLDCITELNKEKLFVPRIAFNVGSAQLMNPELPKLMSEADIGFTRVSVEVLESVLIENEKSKFLERIDALRERDIGIEIDDFGSGHASVVALQQLNPDLMKLDGGLVMPIVESETARKLVKSMIDMGKTLEIDVLAEGVETAEHASILRELGCDAYQGFYFARPMPFEDLRTFARNGFDPEVRSVRPGGQERERMRSA
ncbi:MAG: EAL domain-containing protein, partial [Pseudomonadota bacterium]